MAETVTLDIKCRHCNSLITLEKPTQKEWGRMKCPHCKGRLRIHFDITADPQTYQFMIDPDEAAGNGGSGSASGNSSDPSKNGSEEASESDVRNSHSAKHKTVYSENPADYPSGMARRRPAHYDDNDEDRDEFIDYDRDSGARPHNKNRSGNRADKGRRVKSEPLPFRVFLLRKKLLGLVTEEYDLNSGFNVVGRYDPENQSEVAISGDDSISRRSVRIDVLSDHGDVECILRVLNSYNPIIVNGREIHRGEECYLRFGDTILLGHTKLKLERD